MIFMDSEPADDVSVFPDARIKPRPVKGRGTTLRPDPRYGALARETVSDGWDAAHEAAEEEATSPRTILIRDASKSIINRNDSPDIQFTQSINAYRGCEHGCIYCFARPTHAYLGFSPGVDFETHIVYKEDAAQLLRKELARPGYVCEPIALGSNTDCYQPVERKLRITRGIIEVLAACRHPVAFVTKSALIERDIDLLAEMARDHLVQVMISVTTLNPELARKMEPRAAHPLRRIETIRRLAQAGIPVGVLIAPVIPALNEHEIEAILEATKDAGASSAGCIPIRLPHELGTLFEDWLRQHEPGKADHVLSLIRQMRGGRLNDPRFGARMRGSGPYADMIRQRFRIASQRLGLNQKEMPLDCGRFAPPTVASAQLALF